MKYLNSRCSVSDDGVFLYDGDVPTEDDIRQYVNANETMATKWTRYRHYYKAEQTALILAPPKPNGKPDNRVTLNFAKKLVDTYTGFAVGKPVQITLQEDVANQSLSEWNTSHTVDDVIARVWKQSSIYGKSHFLVYADDGDICVTDADPRTAFVIYDDSVAHKPLCGVVYTMYNAGLKQATVYTPDEIRTFGAASSRETNPFCCIPLIEVDENDEQVSVIANVISIIDELDKAVSEKANDIDYFADAYLRVLGQLLTEDQVANLRDNRIINLKARETDDDTAEPLDVSFLEKPSADGTQENLINRLVDMLYQLSMIVNLNDKDFGNSTGIALQLKYKPMLNLATLKSRGFSRALKEMYRVVFASDQLRGLDETAWQSIDINYQYDLPHDTLTEAQTAQILSGLVSEETWFKTLSVVNDPRQEEENIAKERSDQARANLDLLGGMTHDDSGRREETD